MKSAFPIFLALISINVEVLAQENSSLDAGIIPAGDSGIANKDHNDGGVLASLPEIIVSPTPAMDLTPNIPPNPASLRKIEYYQPPNPPHSRPHNFGFGMDLGIPDGIAVAATIKPNIDWIRFNAAATYNAVAPGIRIGTTIDPIDYWISPSLTVEGGHAFVGNIPIKQAKISDDYINLHSGLEFGSRENFSFFIHGGISWIWVYGNDLNHLFSDINNISISNTTAQIQMCPTAKLGFDWLF